MIWVVVVVTFIAGLAGFVIGLQIGEMKGFKKSTEILNKVADDIIRKGDPSYGLTPVSGINLEDFEDDEETEEPVEVEKG